MNSRSLFRLHSTFTTRRATATPRRKPTRGGRLLLEALEDRTLLSTLQAISLPSANQPPSDTAAGASLTPSVSDDGRYVAFASTAPNLVNGQTGSLQSNVFLFDRQTNTMTLLSHLPGEPTAGPTTSGPSYDPLITGNGQYVAFESEDPALVGGPQQGVLVYSVSTGAITLVSHGSNLDAISGDGTWVVFDSAGNVSVYNVHTKATLLVTHAFGQDSVPCNGSITDIVKGMCTVADNGTIAYADSATNLVSGFTYPSNTPQPGGLNIFLYSTLTQQNQLISTVQGQPTVALSSNLGLNPLISRDGTTVAYVSDLAVLRYSILTGATTVVNAGPNAFGGGYGFGLAMSTNGRYLVFEDNSTNLVNGQTGPPTNAFVYDSTTQQLSLVSGVAGSSTLCAGGVPPLDFTGEAYSQSDPITGFSTSIFSVSDNGLIAFVSTAGNIVPGQSGLATIDNLFIYNTHTGATSLVSGQQGSTSVTASGESEWPRFSADGSVLVFHSLADDLNASLFDGNGVSDILAYSPGALGVSLVSREAFQPPRVSGTSFSTSVSADGRFTVFTSTAKNLVPNQVTPNTSQNIFVFDKQTGQISLVNHVPGRPNTAGDQGLLGSMANLSENLASPPSYMTPVISADGNVIAFASFDDNLVPGEIQSMFLAGQLPSVYLYNVANGVVTLVNNTSTPNIIEEPAVNPVINKNGSFIAYIGGLREDNGALGIGPFNGVGALILYNAITNATTTITFVTGSPGMPFTGASSDPGIDDAGDKVSYIDQGHFRSNGIPLGPGNVYIYDQGTSSNTLVSKEFGSSSQANGTSTSAVISHDGNTIAFVSSATNLVNNEVPSAFTNVFSYNVPTGVVSLVSGVNGSTTTGGNGNSDSPDIDGDGSYVAYRSDATNLTDGLGILTSNIFEYSSATQVQILVSAIAAETGAGTPEGAGGCSEPVIDDDGHLISYLSTADDLIPGQTGLAGIENDFLWLRQNDANILVSGQNGSATITANANCSGPLLTRHSFPGFSSSATNLASGIGGSSVAWINNLVELALSPNILANNAPSGTMVGIVTVSSLLVGQLELPQYSLPNGAGDNGSFSLASQSAQEVLIFVSSTPANYTTKPTYQVTIDLGNIGFGNDSQASLVVYVLPPPAPTVRASYIQQLYVDILKRPADSAALTSDATAFANGSVTPTQVAEAMVSSQEYRGDEVTGAYVSILGRNPDSSGFAGWLSFLNHGNSLLALETMFYGSQEFFSNPNKGDGTNTGFVAALYQGILGRAPDPGAPWVGLLNNRTENTEQVAQAILKSGEAFSDVVQGLYKTYLRRPADAAGLQQFVSVLAGGTPIEQAIVTLVASGEYQSITSELNYVQNLYLDLLGRPADTPSLNADAAVLNGLFQGQSPTFLTNILLTSTEYREVVVNAIYQRYLVRVADNAGLQANATALAHGSTDETIATNVLGSSEFYQDAGGTPATFVNALYEDILGRLPDAGAQGFIDGLANHTLSQAQAAQAILTSSEYHHDLVQSLYLRLLRRPADSAGLTGDVGLLAHGATDETLMTGMTASSEYFALIDKAGSAVSIAGLANMSGIVSDKSTFTTGLGGGLALSANLLGSRINFGSSSYAIGATGAANVIGVLGQTVSLAGNGSVRGLSFLALGINGSQANLQFTVAYADGSTQIFEQSISDWSAPQNYLDESQALAMPYRDVANGTQDNRQFYVYSYYIALNPTKQVQSITLPNDPSIILLAVDLTPT